MSTPDAREAAAPSFSAVVSWLLMGAVAAVYLQVRTHDFVDFDDFSYVVDNPRLREPLDFAAIRRAFTEPYAAYWLPLTWLSLHLDFKLFGLNAGAYLIENALLHAAASVLVFAAIARMTRRPWPAAFVGAVFALHPLHVESVAWVTERKDCLSGLFLGLTLYAYARFCEAPQRRGRLVLALLFFALGLLAKSTLVTLPCILLLLDYWPLRRWGEGLRAHLARVSEKLPFFLLSAVASAITAGTQREGGGMEIAALVGAESRILHAFENWVWYLAKSFWPSGLAAIYPHSLAPPPLWRALLAVLLLLGITAWALRGLRSHPWRFVGWAWFAGALVPMIGLVAAGVQLRADRFTYVPMTGLALLVAFEASKRWGDTEGGRRALAWTGGAAVLAMAVASSQQITHWRNSRTLFERAIAVDPDNWYAHNRLAEHFRREGELDRAEPHWLRAVQLRPYMRTPLTQLAALLERRGQLDHGAALRRTAETLALGDPMGARKVGLAFLRQDRFAWAAPLLQEAVRREPESAQMRAELAVSLDKLGKRADAAAQNRAALDANPKWYFAANNLAWILATSDDAALRNPQEAIVFAKQARDALEREEPAVLDTLAVAYAAAGRWDDAVGTAEQAISLAEQRGNRVLADGIRERLDRYRVQRPWLE